MWYGIGLLYERYGSLDHAEEAYDAVLKMNAPVEVIQEVQLRLGVVSKQRGQYEMALEVSWLSKWDLVIINSLSAALTAIVG